MGDRRAAVAALVLAAILAPRTGAAQVGGRFQLTPEALQAGAPDVGPLPMESGNEERVECALREAVALTGEWRYRAGDDPAWAAADLDDTSWTIAHTAFNAESLPLGWQGIGWYRLHLEVAPELRNIPLALFLVLMGDIEVYLDGKKLFAVGDPGTALARGDASSENQAKLRTVIFDRAEHVLAVRIACPRYERIHAGFAGIGFWITLGRPTEVSEALTSELLGFFSFHRFFAGGALMLALLHLLLWSYYRAAKQNLYFALDTAAVAGIIYFSSATRLSDTVSEFLFTFGLFKSSIACAGVFGLLSAYSIFFPRFPRQTWVFVIAGGVLAFLAYWLPMNWIYAFAIVALLEQARV